MDIEEKVREKSREELKKDDESHVAKNSEKERCRGYVTHWPKECGANSQTCYKCNQTGHLAAYCDLHVGAQAENGFLRNKVANFEDVLHKAEMTSDTSVQMDIEEKVREKSRQELNNNDESHVANNSKKERCRGTLAKIMWSKFTDLL
jgi:hypothetical protein